MYVNLAGTISIRPDIQTWEQLAYLLTALCLLKPREIMPNYVDEGHIE